MGGYSDWQRQRVQRRSEPGGIDRRRRRETSPSKAPRKATPRLGYKQKRELESLPAHIESLEAELATLQAHDWPIRQLYKTGADPPLPMPAGVALARVQSELEKSYERWGELDALAPKD